MICEEIQEKRSGGIWIHQYELNFSVMYSGKVTDSQSTIIPASSLEEANEKLQSEVKWRLGKCSIKVNGVSLCVSEDERYMIE
ncbi:hypothetical protein [Bacillus cereus]|uniref:hypothetical protein n=1 Tax=Bacillus cereus TaxID=1396 RepID=UPI000BF3CF36|nr:hypothetical protein [Bacillus cereus]PFU19434.1 hypothetical protein COK76_31340 [Bacillus cereus]